MSDKRERRRSIRLRPMRAKAVCSTRTMGGVYDIRDVSGGGMLLEGKPTVDPGTRVLLRVHLPGTEPMTLAGRVVRTLDSSSTSRMAVRFSSVRPDDQDRFAELVARAWSKSCEPRCVVASSNLYLRMDLTHRIGALGIAVTRANSPIELIHRLEEARGQNLVVFLGDTLGGCTGEEMAAFLSTAYPSVRRILLLEAGGFAGQVPDPAHAVLEAPWSDESILNEVSEAMRASFEAAGVVGAVGAVGAGN